MGKTASVAMLAMSWVKNSEQLKNFDFVWTLRLRNIDKTSSLAQLIKTHHPKLKSKDIPVDHIKAILEGQTNHKVLLLIDGFDEYKTGTNRDVDEAIKNTIGNCFLLLTSRPGDHYVSKAIRDSMDGVVTIEGFSPGNITKCSTMYLDSAEASEAMLQQAKDNGIFELLKVPIILLMTCVIFNEKENSLPKSMTGIFDTIYELLMDRTTLKTSGCKSGKIDNLQALLWKLGELSWKALQGDQLRLNKV